MNKTVLMRLAVIGCAILLAPLFAFAQEHKWAGRTLNDVEWRSEDMKQTVDKFLDYKKTQQKLQRLQTELELAGG